MKGKEEIRCMGRDDAVKVNETRHVWKKEEKEKGKKGKERKGENGKWSEARRRKRQEQEGKSGKVEVKINQE